MSTTNTDAAAIAAQIDTATVAGHNLRALLLRLADGECWDGRGLPRCVWRAVFAANRMGLVGGSDDAITSLGREVAERLRPAPYYVDGGRGECLVTRARVVFATGGCEETAERIANLLTADDLRAAKTYRTEQEQ